MSTPADSPNSAPEQPDTEQSTQNNTNAAGSAATDAAEVFDATSAINTAAAKNSDGEPASRERYGVAIVGAGAISDAHANAAAALEQLYVKAVVDPDTAAAAKLIERIVADGQPQPDQYTDLTEALKDPDIRLVAITTPSGLHAAQGAAALDSGRHVIIEKPLDTNLQRARLALESAARSGAVSSVISQHRFDPASQFLKAKIEEGALGRITSGIATLSWYRSQEYYDSGAWRGTWEMDGGGALANQGVHQLDLLVWMLGTPVSISAQTSLAAHTGIEVEDTAVAVITFESGALAVLHATTAAYPGLFTRLQIMGSRGSAIIENDDLTYFHQASEQDPVPPYGKIGPSAQTEAARAEVAKNYAPGSQSALGVDPTRGASGHTRQYLDVLQAIAEGGTPLVSIAEAAKSLAVIRAVYVSATLGTPVLYADVLDGKYDDVAPAVRALAPEDADSQPTHAQESTR